MKEKIAVGDVVLVLKPGWSSFIVPKVKGSNDKEKAAPKPWYPHNKTVKIANIRSGGDLVDVIDDDGKSWPYPLAFWNITKDLCFHTRNPESAELTVKGKNS